MGKISKAACSVAIVVALLTPGLFAYGNNSVSQEVVEKLADALWRDIPDSVDITVSEELQYKARTLAEVEQLVRKMYPADDKNLPMTKEDLDALRRDEVARIMKEQLIPKILMKRVVIAGANYRLDITTIREPSDAEGPFHETMVNAVSKESGAITTYRIDRRGKSVSLLKGRDWKKQDYRDLGTFSSGVRLVLKGLLGKLEKATKEEIMFARDEAKISACVKGSEEAAKITRAVETGADGRRVDVLTVFIPGAPHHIGKWVLDASDYNICYREELFNPLTGAPLVIREHSDFFVVEGTDYIYPGHSTFTRFSPEDGSIIQTKNITVESVYIGEIDPNLFSFAPPKDYVVTDRRYGKPITIHPGNAGLSEFELEKMVEEMAEELAVEQPKIAVAAEKEEPALSAEAEPPVTAPEVAVATTTPPSSKRTIYIITGLAALVLLLAIVFLLLRRKAAIRRKEEIGGTSM